MHNRVTLVGFFVAFVLVATGTCRGAGQVESMEALIYRPCPIDEWRMSGPPVISAPFAFVERADEGEILADARGGMRAPSTPLMHPRGRFDKFGCYPLPSLRVIYVHIPKSAGSSVLALLRNATDCPGRADCQVYEECRRVLTIRRFANFTLFTVVRNPIDRACSIHDFALFHRHRAGKPMAGSPTFGQFMETSRPWRAWSGKTPLGLGHALPQADFVLTSCNNWAVDFIVKLEYFQVGMEALIVHLVRRLVECGELDNTARRHLSLLRDAIRRPLPNLNTKNGRQASAIEYEACHGVIGGTYVRASLYHQDMELFGYNYPK